MWRRYRRWEEARNAWAEKELVKMGFGRSEDYFNYFVTEEEGRGSRMKPEMKDEFFERMDSERKLFDEYERRFKPPPRP